VVEFTFGKAVKNENEKKPSPEGGYFSVKKFFGK